MVALNFCTLQCLHWLLVLCLFELLPLPMKWVYRMAVMRFKIERLVRFELCAIICTTPADLLKKMAALKRKKFGKAA